MQAKTIVFSAPWQVDFTDCQGAEVLGPQDILVDTEYTVVSAGTEMAILSGKEPWAALPFVPGYGSVGIVRAVGQAVEKWKPGDRIFSYSPHQSVAKARGLILPVPGGLDPALAVVAGRMGQVAFTAVRVSGAELGDMVAINGLGLVGNLAAQLLTLAGCTVIGIDVLESRLEIARRCGIAHTVHAREADAAARVRELTGGAMCAAVVEATGIPAMVETAASLAGKAGEVILLGSPRGEFTGNAMNLLNAVHLWGNCVTLKGAHEWRYPMYHDPGGFIKHSLERNVRLLFGYAAEGRLHVRELISHIVPPSEAGEVYHRLRERDERYYGVVFDWASLG
ncbi:MAG: zinc-binding alcohol dehydrogenase [Armatimonadetes bacterium]|nr:zinc-binding alcohol dehydrogenase [Armatimonadota bacterium]